jgi:DNA repair protein RecO (recombination protein O)
MLALPPRGPRKGLLVCVFSLSRGPLNATVEGVESTRAIVLRRQRLTETSLIVSWLAPEVGRFKTVAKGALRPRNPLGGLLDLFHLCEIQFQRSRSSELHTLREVVLLDGFPGVRTEVTRVGLAAYGVELIEKTTERETPVPEIFDLLHRLLRFLDAQPATQKALRHLEAELTRVLGIAQPGVPPDTVLERALRGLPAGRDALFPRLA